MKVEVPLYGKLPAELLAGTGIYSMELYREGTSYYYIGQSVNIRKRIKEHRYALRKGLHDNIELQKLVDAGFTIYAVILELSDVTSLKDREQYYLGLFCSKTLLNKNAPAMAPTSGSRSRITKHLRQPIIGINLGTFEILSYASLRAADVDGFNSCLISRCLSGHIGQHKGHLWVIQSVYDKNPIGVIDRAKTIPLNKFHGGVYKKRIEATGDYTRVVFESTSELEKYGFDRRAVHRVLNTSNKHKGYTFKEVKE